MTAVFRTELAKQLRRPRTYVFLGIAVLIPVIATIALKANPPRGPEGPGDLFSLAPLSGLLVAVAATSAAKDPKPESSSLPFGPYNRIQGVKVFVSVLVPPLFIT